MTIIFDFVKIIILITVLFFAYSFLQSNIDNNQSIGGWFSGNTQLQVPDEVLWGTPSPHMGTVSLTAESNPTASNPTDEYLYLSALRTNAKAIDLTGWSLGSLVSDTRVYLPPATLLLKMSGVNDVQPVHLAPGEYAVLHSGSSPIADVTTSFHTNSCIGYVSARNTFTPPIQSACNDPREILPPTPQNIITYGAECVEFLQEADSCRSYTTEMPAHLLPACRELIARKLTYHSCLSEEFERKGYEIFNNGGWYLYLNHNAEVWRNTYEAIQLLDENGLVVDVLQY